MSKVIASVALSVAIMSVIFSFKTSSVNSKNSNREIGIDDHNTFNVAYIYINGETHKVSVKNWRDYSDSDVVQVIDTNNVVYLTSYNNVILVSEDK